ncbi:MAG: diguanylate cyclase [Pseudomonadota bacterium]
MTDTGFKPPTTAITASKDRALVYRACSPAYAELLGAREPAGVIGRRDPDLLRASRAAFWEATQRLVLHDGVSSAMPLVANGRAGAWMVHAPDADGDGIGIAVVAAREVLGFLASAHLQDLELDVGGAAVVVGDRVLHGDAWARDWLAQHGGVRDVERSLRESSGWRAWLNRREGVAAPPPRYAHSDRHGVSLWRMPIRWHRRRAALWLLPRGPARPSALTHVAPQPVRSAITPRPAPAVDTTADIASALLDAAPTGAVLLSGERVVRASGAAARLLGFASPEAACAHLVFPDGVRRRLEAGASQRRAVHCRWQRGDGQALELSLTATRMPLQGQSCLAVYLSDQTPVVRRLTSLAADRERFHDFAESAADYFFELDANLSFVYLSDRFESVFGIQADEVIGLSIEGFHNRYIPQPSSAAWVRHLAALRAQQSQLDFEYHWTRGQGEKRILVHSCHPIADPAGRFSGFRGVGRDITRDRELADQVHYHATHDALTGLVNRREFDRVLEAALAGAKASDATHALCFIDLDHFKHVNDNAGHQAGDTVLQALGARFVECLRQSDCVARLGGDEFGVLIYNCDLERAERLATQLRDAAQDFRLDWEGASYRVGASVGVVALTARSGDRAEVMRAADMACYEAKAAGRGRIALYEPAWPETRAREGVVLPADDVAPVRQGLLRELLVPLRRPLPGDVQRVLLCLDPGDAPPPGGFGGVLGARPTASANADREAIVHCLDWLQANAAELDALAQLQIVLSGAVFADPDTLGDVARRLEVSGVANKLVLEAPVEALAKAASVDLGRLVRWGSGLVASDAALTFRCEHLTGLQLDAAAAVVDSAAEDADQQLWASAVQRAHDDGLDVRVVNVTSAEQVTRLRQKRVDFAAGTAVSAPDWVSFGPT